MIYTVTLNPALDRLLVIDQLVAGETIRILSETSYAAGKGIDASRVIRELGGKSVALGFVGGYDGESLRESIEYHPTCIKPNIHELSRLAGRPLETESQILGYCEKIHRKGIPYVRVSRGKEGLLSRNG